MSIRKLGTNKFQIDFYPAGGKGKRERVTFVGNLLDARKHELELLREFGNIGGDDRDPTFDSLIPLFEIDYRTTAALGTANEFVMVYDKHLKPHFGHLKISRFTPTLIETFKAKRLKQGVKKRTINKELSYLSAVLTWAADPDRNLCAPLTFKIRRYPPKQTKSPKPVVPSPGEVQRWLDHLDGDRRGLFLLMYDAGLRKAEANTIRGAQVDLANGIMIIRGKGDKERIVPILTERLKAELTVRVERHGKGYLYINPRTRKPYNDIRASLKTAAEKAGITKRAYNHLLRHSFGTHSTMAEVHPRSLQMMLGHYSLDMVEIYSTLAADTVKAQGSKFANLVEPQNKSQPVIGNKQKN